MPIHKHTYNRHCTGYNYIVNIEFDTSYININVITTYVDCNLYYTLGSKCVVPA